MRTVDITGGQAFLRERKDMSVRHQRLVESTMLATMKTLAKLPTIILGMDPTTIRVDTLPEIDASDIQHMNELQDATIVALLADWTLTNAEGNKRPLPTMDNILDLELELYEELAEATKKDGSEAIKRVDFGVSPDPKVPISDSESSNTPSSESLQPTPT